MKIAVIGVGAMGELYGGYLSQHNQVVLLDTDKAKVDKICTDGICIKPVSYTHLEEICDLLYHLLVMMAQQGISVEEIEEILEKRRQKIGNLKEFHQTDHNT